MKIVLVGAGSREFGPASIRDILLSDPLCHGGIEIALVDIDPAGLPRTQAYAESVAYRLHRSATVTITTRLADALPGADAVILAIEINRYFYWRRTSTSPAPSASARSTARTADQAASSTPSAIWVRPWMSHAPWRLTARTPGSSTTPIR